MATPTQRLTSLVTATLNRDATAAQVNRVADALGKRTLGAGYAGMATPAKHLHAVRYIHGHIASMIKELDGSTAAANAMTTASAAVDTEFAETP